MPETGSRSEHGRLVWFRDGMNSGCGATVFEALKLDVLACRNWDNVIGGMAKLKLHSCKTHACNTQKKAMELYIIAKAGQRPHSHKPRISP